MKPLSILVADNADDIRALLHQWLTECGHSVVAAPNGNQAIRQSSAQAFDLVITAVLMNDGDGLEVITGLRTARSRSRIVAMSGGGTYLSGTACLKLAQSLGAHAVIMKPFSKHQLLETINLACPPQTETAS